MMDLAIKEKHQPAVLCSRHVIPPIHHKDPQRRAQREKIAFITFKMHRKKAELAKVNAGQRVAPQRKLPAAHVRSKILLTFPLSAKDTRLNEKGVEESVATPTVIRSSEPTHAFSVTVPTTEVISITQQAPVVGGKRKSSIDTADKAVKVRKEKSSGSRVSDERKFKELEQKLADQEMMVRHQAKRISRLEALINGRRE